MFAANGAARGELPDFGDRAKLMNGNILGDIGARCRGPRTGDERREVVCYFIDTRDM